MRHFGQRAIFWPLPLSEGVSTTSTSPPSSSTRSDSMSAFSAKEAPVSRWHQRQWQQWTNSGPELIRYRTKRQVQPPSIPNCAASRIEAVGGIQRELGELRRSFRLPFLEPLRPRLVVG